MRGLRDKIAVVTGSSRGIGAATARRLAEEGCKVVVSGSNEALGEKVVAGIREGGGTASWVRADLEQENEVQHLMDETVRRYGSLQILVNNAAPTDFIATGGDHPCQEQDHR
jgi:3-oxoacyl-[acyl-carrier protein] reductase